MHFRIITRREEDGFEASVPSIRECAAWAKTEEEALEQLLERLAYFLGLPKGFKHNLDRSRIEDGVTHYSILVKR